MFDTQIKRKGFTKLYKAGKFLVTGIIVASVVVSGSAGLTTTDVVSAATQKTSKSVKKVQKVKKSKAKVKIQPAKSEKKAITVKSKLTKSKSKAKATNKVAKPVILKKAKTQTKTTVKVTKSKSKGVSKAKSAASKSAASVATSKSAASVAASKSAASVAASKSAARVAASKSAARVAASKSAASIVASKSAARVAASKSAARVAASKSAASVAASKSAASMAASVTASKSAASVAASKSAARVAASKSAASVTASKSAASMAASVTASKSAASVAASKSAARVAASKSAASVAASKSAASVTASKSAASVAASKSAASMAASAGTQVMVNSFYNELNVMRNSTNGTYIQGKLVQLDSLPGNNLVSSDSDVALKIANDAVGGNVGDDAGNVQSENVNKNLMNSLDVKNGQANFAGLIPFDKLGSNQNILDYYEHLIDDKNANRVDSNDWSLNSPVYRFIYLLNNTPKFDAVSIRTSVLEIQGTKYVSVGAVLRGESLVGLPSAGLINSATLMPKGLESQRAANINSATNSKSFVDALTEYRKNLGLNTPAPNISLQTETLANMFERVNNIRGRGDVSDYVDVNSMGLDNSTMASSNYYQVTARIPVTDLAVENDNYGQAILEYLSDISAKRCELKTMAEKDQNTSNNLWQYRLLQIISEMNITDLAVSVSNPEVISNENSIVVSLGIRADDLTSQIISKSGIQGKIDPDLTNGGSDISKIYGLNYYVKRGMGNLVFDDQAEDSLLREISNYRVSIGRSAPQISDNTEYLDTAKILAYSNANIKDPDTLAATANSNQKPSYDYAIKNYNSTANRYGYVEGPDSYHSLLTNLIEKKRNDGTNWGDGKSYTWNDAQHSEIVGVISSKDIDGDFGKSFLQYMLIQTKKWASDTVSDDPKSDFSLDGYIYGWAGNGFKHLNADKVNNLSVGVAPFENNSGEKMYVVSIVMTDDLKTEGLKDPNNTALTLDGFSDSVIPTVEKGLFAIKK